MSYVPHRRSRIIPTTPGVDIERVLQRLRTSSKLPVESREDLASEVQVIAEKKPRTRGSISYLKAPSPVAVRSPLTTSPADILRELGVATTFVSRSRLLPVAQLWAHVRYCATMRARSGMLALTPDAAQSVAHHHKVAQSEQLGIGPALVVARAVLRQLHPRLDYHVVDADVALRAGYIKGMPGEVRNRPATKKRPDYFLIGYERGAPGVAVHVTVLECKGTHLRMREVKKQLADATLQVRTVVVGTEPLYGLMVASRLKETGIQSYVFDPPAMTSCGPGIRKIFKACCRRCRRRSSGCRAGGSIPQSRHRVTAPRRPMRRRPMVVLEAARSSLRRGCRRKVVLTAESCAWLTSFE